MALLPDDIWRKIFSHVPDSNSIRVTRLICKLAYEAIDSRFRDHATLYASNILRQNLNRVLCRDLPLEARPISNEDFYNMVRMFDEFAANFDPIASSHNSPNLLLFDDHTGHHTRLVVASNPGSLEQLVRYGFTNNKKNILVAKELKYCGAPNNGTAWFNLEVRVISGGVSMKMTLSHYGTIACHFPNLKDLHRRMRISQQLLKNEKYDAAHITARFFLNAAVWSLM